MKYDLAQWTEYDAAADWCAARGLKGDAGDALPANLSVKVMQLINLDQDAFARRVRECGYARSMNK